MLEGEIIVPNLQFADNAGKTSILPGVDKLTKLFREAEEGAWSELQFLVDPDPNLRRPPIEALKDGEINDAKKVLATEATALCHGREAAEEAADTARAVFEGGGAGDALPQVDVDRTALATGMPAFELFVRAGLAASNGEARRLIKGGGARLNDALIGSEVQKVTLADLDAAGAIKLSAGRKRHALVRPN